MKKISLTQGKVAIVNDEDFERIAAHSWYAQRHGTTFYAVRNSPRAGGRQTKILMHREILNASSGSEVDHIDGNGLDNRRENIRLATNQQNQQNCRKRLDTSSRFKGVTWHKRDKKWQASIQIDRKAKHLGYFLDESEAGRAYDAIAKEFFGEFARLNFSAGRSAYKTKQNNQNV